MSATDAPAGGAPAGALDRSTLLEALDAVWASLDELLAPLTAEQWATRTGLPGWTVGDVVAHIIGTESMLAGDPFPAVDVDVASLPHVANEIAAANEVWVQSMRGTPGPQLLGRLRDILARRRETLHGMTQADLDAPSWTPVGQATYGRFLQIRVFDCWMHEQDIRAALGLPGTAGGPAAAVSLAEVTLALGYLLGKRAGLPQGAGVRFELTGPLARELCVAVAGRAAVVSRLEGPATVTLRLPAELLLRLSGGRCTASDHAADIGIDGDADLARRLLDNLAFTI
jgi:uncharacterized protein (TIGR03083 family)